MLYYDKFDIWATGSFAPLAVEIFLGKKNDSYTGPYRKRENLKKKRRREKMLKKKKKQIKNKKLNELGYPVNDPYGLFAAFRRAFNGDK